MLYPLAICGACIITSIVGTFFVKLGANGSIMGALYKGLIVTGLLSIVGLGVATSLTIGWGDDRHRRRHARITGTNLFICGLVGLVVTGADRRDHRILHRHRQAPGQLDRPGLGHRPRHQRHPGPRGLAGIDGAAGASSSSAASSRPTSSPACSAPAIAVTTMLGLAGMIVALDAFGPVTDNAGGIAEMAGLPQGSAPVHRRARRGRQHHQGGDQGLRDRLGRPRRAGAVRRLHATTSILRRQSGDSIPISRASATISFDLSNPYVVAGLIFGGLIPYLFGGIAMTAVGRAAGVDRRGSAPAVPRKAGHHGRARERPTTARAVDLLTKAAIQEMIVPSLLPVLAPLVVYFGVLLISGSKASAFAALGASLLGVIVNGLFVAISMTSGGGAWDNAKKSLRGRLRRQGRRQAHEGLGGAQGLGDRRHGRRSLQGHRRPGRQPGDQDHQHRGAAAARRARARLMRLNEPPRTKKPAGAMPAGFCFACAVPADAAQPALRPPPRAGTGMLPAMLAAAGKHLAEEVLVLAAGRRGARDEVEHLAVLAGRNWRSG